MNRSPAESIEVASELCKPQRTLNLGLDYSMLVMEAVKRSVILFPSEDECCVHRYICMMKDVAFYILSELALRY